MIIIAAATSAFLICAILLKLFIPILRKAKMGQKILEIGPNWHKSKEGTPTMGGLFFIIATIVVIFALRFKQILDGSDMKLLICVLMAVAFGCIGFIDDYVKLFKKRNKGLGMKSKLLLQGIVCAAFLASMRLENLITTAVYIPVADIYLELGNFYYIVMLIVIVYIVNCANLTDGIDGLAGSVAVIITALFVLIGVNTEDMQLTTVASAAGGSLLGFLVFNFHPAKIFMGDTGSLYLGGLVVGMSFMIDNPFIMLPVCFIYIVEGISDILQVSSYKLTGKRIFKMCPIHHHFEKCGWSEVKIVAVFSAVTVIFCALAYFLHMSIYN